MLKRRLGLNYVLFVSPKSKIARKLFVTNAKKTSIILIDIVLIPKIKKW